MDHNNCFDCNWISRHPPYQCERIAVLLHGSAAPVWLADIRFAIHDGRLGEGCAAFVRREVPDVPELPP
jgi:hypothetical protein